VHREEIYEKIRAERGEPPSNYALPEKKTARGGNKL